MKNIIQGFSWIIILIIALLGFSSVYTVDETEQVVITQFGEPIGKPVKDAGLKFKIPFIQQVNRFDKRLLQWDGNPKEIPTKDKRFIWVDTTARWKIIDPLKFMQSVGTESLAQSRLDDIIEGATINVISSMELPEVVRDTNAITETSQAIQKEIFGEGGFEVTAIDKIQFGRNQLTRQILDRAAEDTINYGIELIDVRVKRINYVESVRRKVYERMISERKRAAEQYRSEGKGKKAEIEGRIAKELEQIQSEAYRKAQEIKGKADAEAVNIYAEAYNNDPEFYSFIKTLEAYRKTLGSGTTLLLSTEGEFFKYLQGDGGLQ